MRRSTIPYWENGYPIFRQPSRLMPREYIGFATPELRLPIAFAVLLIVLLIKPNGLFGRRQVRRV